MSPSPLLRLILWTTEKVYDALMKPIPKAEEGCQKCVDIAEDDLLSIFMHADLTSYRIANIMSASYLHAPLCPLPAELTYLVPILTWDCLAMTYRHVRLLAAEKHRFGNICNRIPGKEPPLTPAERRENDLIRLADEFLRNVIDGNLDENNALMEMI